MLVTSTIAGAHVTRIPARCATRPAPLLCAIHWHRDHADQLRSRMALPRRRYAHQAEHHPSWRPRLLRHWRHAHATAARHWRRYEAAPWLHGSWHTDALCVHSHEGAWNANTGNGYYGGLQMDLGFQSTYGQEWLHEYGTADQWPTTDQLHAAYSAWRNRGWSPWPNTARACGLL